MSKHHLFLTHCLLFATLSFSCDSPTALTAVQDQSQPIPVWVNVESSQDPRQASTVIITNPNQLPAELRNADEIEVVYDASKTSFPVEKQADGTWSFTLATSRFLDSTGNLTVLLVGDQRKSYTVQLRAGNPFELAQQPIQVEPSNTVTQGTRVLLRLQPQNDIDLSQFAFTWEAAPSSAGPFTAISGSGAEVEWVPPQNGSYYLRISTTDIANGSVSTYLSPTPEVYVQAPDEIARVSASNLVTGEEVQLSVNLPEYAGREDLPNFQWFYATSPQSPFQPIAERGAEISWEPPAAGAYFLRIQASENGRLSSYTSSKPQVLVASADDSIVTQPLSGSVVRGEQVGLSALFPSLPENASFTWLYSFSPQGPFTPIAETGRQIEWIPPLTGDFFIRVRSFNPETGQSRSYTSSQSLVSVRDSNNSFVVTPSSGSITRGKTVRLQLKDAPSENINWSFGSEPQGAFENIPAAGSDIRWTPTSAGRFYIRASVTRNDGSISNFSSADPLVLVSEPAQAIRASRGNLELGQFVRLSNNTTERGPAFRYSWSYSSSAQGPFTPMTTLESSTQATVTWYPPAAGAYFIKTEVSNSDAQTTLSFTSSEPLVRVNEGQPFFSTSPASGRIQPNDALTLRSRFDNGGRSFNYGWAYSSSNVGPFTPIGGSSATEILWDDDNKPTGTYFIRFQATAPGTERIIRFVSQTPLVFVSENESGSNEFGKSQSTPPPTTGFPGF